MNRIYIFLAFFSLQNTWAAERAFFRCHLSDPKVGINGIAQGTNFEGEALALDLDSLESQELVTLTKLFQGAGLIKPFAHVTKTNFWFKCEKGSSKEVLECVSQDQYVGVVEKYQDSKGFFHEDFHDFTPLVHATLRQSAERFNIELSLETKDKFVKEELELIRCSKS